MSPTRPIPIYMTPPLSRSPEAVYPAGACSNHRHTARSHPCLAVQARVGVVPALERTSTPPRSVELVVPGRAVEVVVSVAAFHGVVAGATDSVSFPLLPPRSMSLPAVPSIGAARVLNIRRSPARRSEPAAPSYCPLSS